jgi:3-isopropylmalate/(R)-2-methylmalate dehydratase large subunit
MAQTLFAKIWDAHLVAKRSDGRDIVYVDRHIMHDLHAPIAMQKIVDAGRSVHRPDLTWSSQDHSVSIQPDRDVTAREGSPFNQKVRVLAQKFGIRVFDIGDSEQGISHVIGPELGMVFPGSTYACPDSHACTIGGLGALAFACGTSELEHVLATQSIAMLRPKTMRVTLTGKLKPGVTAKDVILRIIAQLGVDGARGYAVEYAGPVAEALEIEGRLTLCNMSIEWGARTGLIAPDEKTFAWLKGRPYMPTGAEWDAALADWRQYKTDPGAAFDKEHTVECGALDPQITWGTNPGQVIGIADVVPDPSSVPAERRDAFNHSLEYMGLKAGQKIEGVPVDVVFIGSCNNARLSDLEEVAKIVKGKKLAGGVRAIIVPGSSAVKRAAEAKGFDKIFKDAGFLWAASGCSMCAGGEGITASKGQRVLSTTNRNFENRQGAGVRTHLVSPAMAAAAAITGKITDSRAIATA